MSVENRLRAYAEEQRNRSVDEEKLQSAIRKSKEAFLRSEMDKETSWLEFLRQQAAYIRKWWWFAQGSILFVLWLVLYLSDSSVYGRRYMGILAPCFVILLLPELWKNRSSGSMEVEGAAYFSLQKIYAARLMLFGMVDVCMISAFLAVSAFSVQIAVMDILIQFVLPLNVTCCICFRTLCSRRNINVFSSLTVCFSWIAGWIILVSNGSIYEKISMPIWVGAIILSFIYLCYSVLHVWKDCQNYYEIDGVIL